ncbi:MAG: hypothetical protein FWH20_04995 [Oscillospiraceae bacterium]|nr:hypothetical protein [Oscillospiraceae bacterium]
MPEHGANMEEMANLKNPENSTTEQSDNWRNEKGQFTPHKGKDGSSKPYTEWTKEEAIEYYTERAMTPEQALERWEKSQHREREIANAETQEIISKEDFLAKDIEYLTEITNIETQIEYLKASTIVGEQIEDLTKKLIEALNEKNKKVMGERTQYRIKYSIQGDKDPWGNPIEL